MPPPRSSTATAARTIGSALPPDSRPPFFRLRGRLGRRSRCFNDGRRNGGRCGRGGFRRRGRRCRLRRCRRLRGRRRRGRCGSIHGDDRRAVGIGPEIRCAAEEADRLPAVQLHGNIRKIHRRAVTAGDRKTGNLSAVTSKNDLGLAVGTQSATRTTPSRWRLPQTLRCRRPPRSPSSAAL